MLTISNLATLPATANDFLFACELHSLSPNCTFQIFQDDFAEGVIISIKTNRNQVTWGISFNDASATEIGSAFPITTGFLSNASPHGIAVSVDVPTQVVQILVDGTAYTYPSSDPNVFWTSTNPIALFPADDPWSIGPVANSGRVCLSALRFGAGEGFFDLSVGANQLKLFNLDNTQANWGANGSAVTGFIPAVYLHASGAPVNFATNLGSSGNFIPNTALVACP